jgi:hypothetical protein
MSDFLTFWKDEFRLRNILLIIYSLIAFALIGSLKDIPQIENLNIRIAAAIALIFYLFVFSICSLEWIFVIKTFDEMVYIVCLWIFGFSVFISVFIRDVNVIVASSTLLLVIITAYSIKKTTDISLKQLKFQNDPVIFLSLKENEEQVQVIDLIIENAGNGIARNVKFSISPEGFSTMSGDPMEQLYFFQRGLQILPSKQRYIIHLVNFAQMIQGIRERHNIPFSDSQLTQEEAQRFRRLVRYASEFSITVNFDNNEGEHQEMTFNFNLCIFWGLRYPRRQYQ